MATPVTARTRAFLAITGALAIVAGALVVVAPASASQSTQLQTAQDQLANCQLLAQNSSGSQRSRAQDCVTDQRRIITLLTRSTPTPTAAPTTPGSTPTPTPTTPAPTTPPATTPPVTTPPPTTPTPASGWPTAATTGVPAGWQPASTSASGQRT